MKALSRRTLLWIVAVAVLLIGLACLIGDAYNQMLEREKGAADAQIRYGAALQMAYRNMPQGFMGTGTDAGDRDALDKMVQRIAAKTGVSATELMIAAGGAALSLVAESMPLLPPPAPEPPPVTEPPKATIRTARIVRVIDGDTFLAHDEGQDERIRIIGIDAPEADQPGADTARAAARRLLDDRTVSLETPPGTDRDHFGRLLAYVRLDDGTDVGRALILGRFAVAYDKYPHPRAAEYAGIAP